MVGSDVTVERTHVRRPFPAWSVELPASFAEMFVEEGSYWHAYDHTRSVSLTSLAMTFKGRRASASEILGNTPRIQGKPVAGLPVGLLGSAAASRAPKGARASRVLSGTLATEGRLLLVTITSDDLEWARGVWLSIRGHRG